jgi:hypothetical protein
MKTMKNYIIAAIMILSMNACTKQTVVDTGVPDARYNGTMMQFLRADDYNWKLTVELIERAGLTDLFEGRVDSLKEITFLGFKSISIQRFLYDSQYKNPANGIYMTVQDIPVPMARTLVLKHVIKGKYLKEVVPLRNKEYQISDPRQTGGVKYTTLEGNRVWLYLEGSPYGGVPDAGPVVMKVYSITQSRAIPMATPDIQPLNGVIHALNYGYEFGII